MYELFGLLVPSIIGVEFYQYLCKKDLSLKKFIERFFEFLFFSNLLTLLAFVVLSKNINILFTPIFTLKYSVCNFVICIVLSFIKKFIEKNIEISVEVKANEK